jgi:hypothetical protein
MFLFNFSIHSVFPIEPDYELVIIVFIFVLSAVALIYNLHFTEPKFLFFWWRWLQWRWNWEYFRRSFRLRAQIATKFLLAELIGLFYPPFGWRTHGKAIQLWIGRIDPRLNGSQWNHHFRHCAMKLRFKVLIKMVLVFKHYSLVAQSAYYGILASFAEAAVGFVLEL